jgi:phosphatidylglycerol:prolipoprotein diacylglycerol transferase
MTIISPNSPFLLQTSFFSVRWYGFLIAGAILTCYFITLKHIKRVGIDENQFDGIFLLTVAMGIVGARLAFVIQDLDYFVSHFKEIFYIFDGGLSIHGAIIMGVLGLYLACLKYRVNFLKIANIIAPNLLLAGAIGRWGNFFNQEIVGRPALGSIKLFISLANRPLGFESYSYFLPVFLYESVFLFSFFVLYQIFSNKLKDYALGYTLITYSIARIIVEYFRIDYNPLVLSFDLAQLVSMVIIAVGFLVIYFSKRART